MTPRHHGELVVISGPCRGIRIPLTLDSMRIGRERICEIHLDDEAASRVHSEIVKRGGKVFLRDLKSTNGTFHNDARVSESLLQNGDRIGIGDSVMQIQLPRRSDKSSPQIIFSQDVQTPGVGVSMSLGDTRFLEMKEGATAGDVQKQFTLLYEFISDVSGILHQPALLERALDRFFDAFPAERGLILLMTAEGVPGLQVTRVREGVEADSDIAISRTMLQLLLEKKESFLSTNPETDERFAGAESIQRLGACSILGVPLKVKDRVGGMIYLDTSNPSRSFSEEHLKLCTAMALQLAVCLENTRLYTELLNAAEFNNSVLRALSSGIMVVDTQSRVLNMNRAALDILDKTESQIVGRPLSEFPEVTEFQKAVKNTLANGKPEDRYELKLTLPSGLVTLGLSTSLLTDYAGTVSGVVISFRNLGALRKLEDQARNAHYLDALAQMAAGVAHEIRNPLNSIRGFTQMVFEHQDTGRVGKEYTQIILEEVDRMNAIVQDMLDFSRQRQLTLLPLSLTKVIEELVRDMQVDARQTKVSLEMLEPGEDLPHIMGNRDKLRQVFRNIVLNALQACRPNGSVTIGFQPVESQVLDPKTKSLDHTLTLREVVVHVNDNGCGMPAEIQRKIFDPFFTQKETGTGLGLSISQKIIEQHRGRIEVKSDVGTGSTFSVHFPAIKID